jgi:ribosomal protein S18 acetylase RimI-like enzyme
LPDRETVIDLLIAQLLEHRLPAAREGVAGGVDLALAQGSPAWLWLAEREGRPVGVFLANRIVSVERGGATLWIEELYVVPEARRQGVARAMLERVFETARRSGIRAVDLEVVPTQAAAFALYRSLGFGDVGRERMTLLLH